MVEADTYLATSKDAANAFALQDIAANGQTWVNNNALCVLAANTIRVMVSKRVDVHGTMDEVYVRARTFEPVTTDLTVAIHYNYNGMGYIYGTVTIPDGGTQSPEANLGQFISGEGFMVEPFIFSVSPETDGTTSYIF